MASKRIHIAGFAIRIGTKGRQLCAWCGCRLIDDDYERMMVAPNADGTPPEAPRFFESNALVAVEGNGKWVVQPEAGGRLPRECCSYEGSPRVVN